MRKTAIVLVFAAAVASLLAPGVARSQDQLVDTATRMIQAGDYDAAIDLLTAYMDNHPEDGIVLATLANAYHLKGDYDNAIAMNRRAAAFPGIRQTALYNEACGLSLSGKVEEAHAVLLEALAEGFLDFDLLAEDPDLEAVRAEYEVELPETHEYERFTSDNGIEIQYHMVLPVDYNEGDFYPTLILFPPGGGTRSADWAIDELVGEGKTDGWVVVCVVAPEEGWLTHPVHRAMVGLLRELQSDRSVEGGKFHLAGFASGARAAATYALVSQEYFQTLTCFSAWHWAQWNEEQVSGLQDLPVRLVVGDLDDFGLPLNEAAEEDMAASGVDVALIVLEGDNQLLAGMRRGRLLDYVPRRAGQLKTSW